MATFNKYARYTQFLLEVVVQLAVPASFISDFSFSSTSLVIRGTINHLSDSSYALSKMTFIKTTYDKIAPTPFNTIFPCQWFLASLISFNVFSYFTIVRLLQTTLQKQKIQGVIKQAHKAAEWPTIIVT